MGANRAEATKVRKGTHARAFPLGTYLEQAEPKAKNTLPCPLVKLMSLV